MTKVNDLHRKWMKNKQYRKAYEELAPEFALADSTGVVRRLDELVARGMGVVVFYRGHW